MKTCTQSRFVEFIEFISTHAERNVAPVDQKHSLVESDTVYFLFKCYVIELSK